jgi:hypothetical protein
MPVKVSMCAKAVTGFIQTANGSGTMISLSALICAPAHQDYTAALCCKRLRICRPTYSALHAADQELMSWTPGTVTEIHMWLYFPALLLIAGATISTTISQPL